ncbi:MAG: hypothetical protein KGO98_02010 [Rickettsiales bacterium]|nr:hypothetical protein [Rickettsiales bacterium]
MKKITDIRESFLIFPEFTQGFFTWFTGKALEKQKAKYEYSFWFYYFWPIGMVVFGILLSLIIVTRSLGLYYLIFTWIMILNGARSIALTIRHQCIHSVFSGNPGLDIILAEFATSIIYAQDAVSYKKDHIDLHHNRKVLAGCDDSHIIALKRYGFIPGMSKRNLWFNLLLLIVSPIFQIKHSLARLKCNFYDPSIYRISLSCVTLSFWFGIFAYFSEGSVNFIYNIFLTFIVPVFLLCNISVILEMIAEHEYYDYDANANLTSNAIYASKCWAIFCGAQVPEKQKNVVYDLWVWFVWVIHMLIHLIIRLTVLPGDIVTHDFHHRHPYSKEWKNYSFARQEDIEQLDKKWPPYTEVWGLFNAIDKVFISMSKSKTKC